MIYADNAATTRVSDSVLQKMLPFLQEQYGNASSSYSFGVKCRHAIENAQKQVATAIGAKPTEITFTAGGSDANCRVLRNVADSYRNQPIHIITSAIEHPSVLQACQALERCGVDVTYLPVNNSGQISVTDVENAFQPHTKLVSIMLGNNEIGTLQPIAEISKVTSEKGILLHTDAVQAIGHIPVNVDDLQVDFLSASAHKFHSVKGTGFLYTRSGVDISPMGCGGGAGSHIGTEFVAGIVGTGYAIEESIMELSEVSSRLKAMVEQTIKGIKAKIPSMRINGHHEHRLPGIVNFGFDGVAGESMLQLLDLKGICVSTRSACTSGKVKPSHVLLALGQSENQATSAIRISYGKYNTPDEVEKIVTTVCDAYEKIIGRL